MTKAKTPKACKPAPAAPPLRRPLDLGALRTQAQDLLAAVRAAEQTFAAGGGQLSAGSLILHSRAQVVAVALEAKILESVPMMDRGRGGAALPRGSWRPILSGKAEVVAGIDELWASIRLLLDDRSAAEGRVPDLQRIAARIENVVGLLSGDREERAVLTETENAIVQALTSAGPLSAKEVAGRINVSQDHARHLLGRLKQLRLVTHRAGLGYSMPAGAESSAARPSR